MLRHSKHKELTPYQRGIIVGMHLAGKSYDWIYKKMGVLKSTAYYIVQAHNSRIQADPQAQAGPQAQVSSQAQSDSQVQPDVQTQSGFTLSLTAYQGQSYPRPGRSRKTTKAIDEILLDKATENPEKSMMEMVVELQSLASISLSTFRRRLREQNLKK